MQSRTKQHPDGILDGKEAEHAAEGHSKATPVDLARADCGSVSHKAE
jgi:hypothetical protein